MRSIGYGGAVRLVQLVTEVVPGMPFVDHQRGGELALLFDVLVQPIELLMNRSLALDVPAEHIVPKPVLGAGDPSGFTVFIERSVGKLVEVAG